MSIRTATKDYIIYYYNIDFVVFNFVFQSFGRTKIIISIHTYVLQLIIICTYMYTLIQALSYIYIYINFYRLFIYPNNLIN
jgi:hypothetical protein